MKLVAKEWEITIVGNSFKAQHIGCDEGAIIFNRNAHSSPMIMDHDEDSYCVCKCMVTSPRLKDFEIVTES